MLNNTDKLVEARHYVADPNNWVKGKLVDSHTKDGNVKVCSLGALAMVAENHAQYLMLEDYLDRAILKMKDDGRLGKRVVSINDGSFAGHETVVEMFDLAIQITKNES